MTVTMKINAADIWPEFVGDKYGNVNSQTKRGNHQRLLVSHGNCRHDCHWGPLNCDGHVNKSKRLQRRGFKDKDGNDGSAIVTGTLALAALTGNPSDGQTVA